MQEGGQGEKKEVGKAGEGVKGPWDRVEIWTIRFLPVAIPNAKLFRYIFNILSFHDWRAARETRENFQSTPTGFTI